MNESAAMDVSFLPGSIYPASIIRISINDRVVHGIPSKHRYLNEGDVVSLDTGVIWKGYQSGCKAELIMIERSGDSPGQETGRGNPAELL